MTFRRVVTISTLFVVTAVLLAVVFLGPSLFSASGGGTVNPVVSPTSSAPTNPIATENKQLGSPNWVIPKAHQATTQIQAFAGATSVALGQSIKFYVSTQTQGTHYRIDFYRLGWYDGEGARFMLGGINQIGVYQGFYDNNNNRLVCSYCRIVDKATSLMETNWKDQYTLAVPADWTSGVYLAKFTDAQGWQTYAPFDVTGSPTSTYVLVTPDTTAQAYNRWGGASLYEEDDRTTFRGVDLSPGAGVQAVSFDRPYVSDSGAGLVLTYELPTIRWLERMGYDVSYISSTDLHTNPGQLLTHKGYISIGHDEYWTKEMRDGVEAARDHGVGLAFLGANTGYWQMRFDKDSAGIPNRTIICYKVQTSNNDLARDPNYRLGGPNLDVTAQWRDPVLHRPENELTGVMFSELTHLQAGFPWVVDPKADSPLLKNTGLQPGKAYGCGIVGYEWDRVFDQPTDDPVYKAATPKGVQILSTSPTHISDGNNKGLDRSNSIYYIAPSGALVFASGSIYWGSSLDDYRSATTQGFYQSQLNAACGGDYTKSTGIPEMQKLMANVMTAMIVAHPSGHL